MTKWSKILMGIGAGLGALALAVPGVQLVALPVLGAVTLPQVLGWSSAFLLGWGKMAPDHAAAPDAEPTK